MPHDPSGPCVVCGIETTQRCSSCAEHGFDLFLCGREHQKLICFAHKPVCGVNSNPFRFPPLTDEVVEEALTPKQDEFANMQDGADGLAMLVALTPDQVPPFLESLKTGATSPYPRSNVATSLCCATVRAYIHVDYRTRMLVPEAGERFDDPKMVDAHRVTAWAASSITLDASMQEPRTNPSPPPDAHRYLYSGHLLNTLYNNADTVRTRLHHFLLVHSAMFQRFCHRATLELPLGNLPGWLLQSWRRIEDFVAQTAVSCPGLAEHLQKGIRKLGRIEEDQ